jgi:hypothetical protein
MATTTREECRDVHKELNKHLLTLTEDVGYIKGKVDEMAKSHDVERNNNSDWWSRMIAFVALAIAYFKGA